MGDDRVSSYVWERLVIFYREKLGLICSVELENYQSKKYLLVPYSIGSSWTT
jgi:hypothetical protein